MLRAGMWLRSTRNRRLVLALAAAGALALVALRGRDAYLGGFGSVGSLDFIEYWSAARLAIDGANPYDAAAVMAVERALGWPYNEALLMWNPPWTLAIVMPVALLPFGVASFVWLLLQVPLLLVSGFYVWRYFAPESERPWIGLLLAVGFFPSWSALYMGQISPWLLAGVVGFLWAEREGRDLLAGVALALLMIKPHVTYLFFLAALWWIWWNRRWRIPLGWLVTLVGASGLVLMIAPDVFTNYLVAASNPPVGFQSTTFGGWLRVLLGWELTWLQFVPALLGGLGLVAWLWRRQGPWRWEVVAGPLLLASMVTAAYGWSHDQVVLLPAVAVLVSALSAKPALQRRVILGALLASQVGLWAMNHWGVNDALAVWHAPVLSGLYWWTVRRAGEQGNG